MLDAVTRTFSKAPSLVLALLVTTDLASAVPRRSDAPKPASDATRRANEAVLEALPFAEQGDFADAERGFIAPLANDGVIRGADGKPIWDLSQLGFVVSNEVAPSTVNPSLWRQSRLITKAGLFKVDDRIYQVRGADLSNVTFIEGERGVIVMDPLVSEETAQAALELYYQYRPRKPVTALIYSHSHIDHFGGSAAIVSLEDARSGRVPVVAPQGFLEEAVSEAVFAGTAMARRSTYMYGEHLPVDAQALVTSGLGFTTSKGTTSIVPPNVTITKTGQELTVDGLSFVFQLAPNTEAPAEMHFYIRELRALCTAENAVHTLHNLYTLRGAKIRDPRAWASALDESIRRFGDQTDVLFAPHHWPRWGNGSIVDFLKKQRDMYQYINDQTLRLANQGYKMNEIAERFQVPDSLAKEWYLRGYYGTINHNVKSTYVHYLGWYDSNPATLHPLPDPEASQRYVEFMGGSGAVISKARGYFERGDYRWVAQVVNHVVMAEPSNQAARELQADALEQLGYQSESGPWRNEYLSAALELRKGVQTMTSHRSDPEYLMAMPFDLLLDALAIHVDGPRAGDRKLAVGLRFTDTGEQALLSLENGVLHPLIGQAGGEATLSLKRSDFSKLLTQDLTLVQLIAAGGVSVSGSRLRVIELFSLMDKFDASFPIVTSKP